jgi:hypothetical protein
MAQVITHRGLDAAREPYYKESSIEAFADQLRRGYGLEFDVRLTRDDNLVVIHDATLERISCGGDSRHIRDVELAELLALEFDGCHLTSFSHLLSAIGQHQRDDVISAIHIKASMQDQLSVGILIRQLEEAELTKPFLLFDVRVETARYMKSRIPSLSLAPSVAHPYDIRRFNDLVGGTLLSLEAVGIERALFDWVWLDEWDRADMGGARKKFYTPETFEILRAAGFKIALVTPELHASSPGLLAREQHEDAKDAAALERRLLEILALGPDAVCTDYPDLVSSLAVPWERLSPGECTLPP